jgi:hypothetical protein
MAPQGMAGIMSRTEHCSRAINSKIAAVHCLGCAEREQIGTLRRSLVNGPAAKSTCQGSMH